MDAKTADLLADLSNRFGEKAAQVAFDMAVEAKRRGDMDMATRLTEVAAALTASLPLSRPPAKTDHSARD